jgi:hypothetical protein
MLGWWIVVRELYFLVNNCIFIITEPPLYVP